jgi:hypothetical protein
VRLTIHGIIPALFCLSLILAGCKNRAGETERTDRIIGVKIYEHQGDFEELIQQWKELGINTVFCSIELYSNSDFRKITRDNNLTTFIIFPVFYDPESLSKDSGLYALTERGNPAMDDWVTFVCPSRTEYRKQKVDSLMHLIQVLEPDGISIDFIRHFIFWEKVYPDTHPDSLLNTCFDSSCLAAFQENRGLRIPDSLQETEEIAGWVESNCLPEWTQWKCGLITSMIRTISEVARETKPDIKINVHLVPWRTDDFNGAIHSIAGQDFSGIAPLVDYLSPMTYAHMVKRDPSWIHSEVQDVYKQTESRVVPSIQVKEAYLKERLTVREFKKSLSKALEPPSYGVVFWSWEQLETEPGKREVIEQWVQNLEPD